MFITIDMTSDIPIYKQLKQSIIKGIATNELKSAEALPSVRQLAADLSVNMHTIAKAYAQLKEDGFISVHRNKGALVNSPPQYAANEKYLVALKQQLQEQTIEAHCRGLSKDDWVNICEGAYEKFTMKKETKK